jgi:hypothetical protein
MWRVTTNRTTLTLARHSCSRDRCCPRVQLLDLDTRTSCDYIGVSNINGGVKGNIPLLATVEASATTTILASIVAVIAIAAAFVVVPASHLDWLFVQVVLERDK